MNSISDMHLFRACCLALSTKFGPESQCYLDDYETQKDQSDKRMNVLLKTIVLNGKLPPKRNEKVQDEC